MFLQNFVSIGWTAETEWFLISNMAAVGHIYFFWNMQIITFCAVYNGHLHVPAKLRLDRSDPCGDISIYRFLYAGRLPSWICEIWNLTSHTVYSQNPPICTIFHHNRFNGCGDIAIFGFLVWRPSAILNFRNMQIFIFCAVYNGNLHVPAKFCLDRFNVSGDIAIFGFPIWRPSAIWIFAICKFSLSARFTMVNCMFLQNFVSIGETVAEVSPLFGFQ